MLHSKEFYELMNQFERDAKHLIRTGQQGLIREPKENWSKGIFYCDGNANIAFQIYQAGYSFSKCVYAN